MFFGRRLRVLRKFNNSKEMEIFYVHFCPMKCLTVPLLTKQLIILTSHMLNVIWHIVRAWYVHSNGKQWSLKAAGSIVLRKQTSCGRKLSVQRQTKVKIHMSYEITFDIWESLNYELMSHDMSSIKDMTYDIWILILFISVQTISYYKGLWKSVLWAPMTKHHSNLILDFLCNSLSKCNIYYMSKIGSTFYPLLWTGQISDPPSPRNVK